MSNFRSWVSLTLGVTVLLTGPQPVEAADPKPSGQSVESGNAAKSEAAATLRQRTLDSLDRVMALPEAERAGNPLAGIAAVWLYRLQSQPAAEVYALLSKWTLPGEGRSELRQFIGFLPDAPPPDAFLSEPLPRMDDPLMATATLLVEAARRTQKLEELSQALKPLVSRRVAGAESLQLLVELEQGQFHSASQRMTNLAVQRGQVQPTAFGNRRVAQNLMDGLLVKAALRHPLTRGAGNLLHTALLKNAKQSANFGMICWLNRTGGLAAIAGVEETVLKPAPNPGFKHWVPVDVASAANVNTFVSTSWWIAADDRIGHVSSPWIDTLVFAYPLTGTFEIHGESFNGLWSEANLGFGGLVFEAWNQGSNKNQVYPINQHDVQTGPKGREFRDRFNATTVRVTPQRLQMSGNNEVLFEDDQPSGNSPFLMLRTTWLSAFRNLRIVGNPVIPREVRLLDHDRMEGWVTSFYNESQPSTLTARTNKTPEIQPADFDWAVKDDVLHGRRLSEQQQAARQSGYQHGESWAYFHRPLRDGERIRYEFFYQPGNDAIEAHPTLDRLVFLLDPDGVKLHWLTTNTSQADATPWIATDNRVEEPAHRRGPPKLPLKPGAWNTATLEILNQTVLVALNDTLVYLRPVEPSWGTRFGFYHDRAGTTARIRNIVLSGNWPAWSPKLNNQLLELVEPQQTADTEVVRAILTPRLLTNE